MHETVWRGPTAAPRRQRLITLLTIAVALASGGCSIFRVSKRSAYSMAIPLTVSSPAFRRSLDTFGNVMVSGNRASLLNNGDAFFPAMLRAIDGAKRSVNLESYIFADDEAGQTFAKALIGAVQRGVEVRVLLDGAGGRAGSLYDPMQRGGVKIRIYRPVRPWTLHHIGRRTHRKILIVDGQTCFTGGVGIRKEWMGNARTPKEWRDIVVQVEGPVAQQMQAIFSEDWTYTTGEVLAGELFYPPVAPAGKVEAQALKVSRGDSSSLAKELYFLTIHSAQRTIRIQNPYFLPDAQIRDALVDAVRRGVDVQVMVPGRHIDMPLVRVASRYHYGQLLKGGVRIFEYGGTMLHSKTAVFDGTFAIVGSINFETRSLMENAEDGLLFYDAGLASQLASIFDADLKKSVEMTYRGWKRRGFEQRIAEIFSSFFRPLY